MAKIYVDTDDGGRTVYYVREDELVYCLRTISKFATRAPIEAIPASSKEQRFAEALLRVRRYWDDLSQELRPDLCRRIQDNWGRPPTWFFETGNSHHRADVNNANQAIDSILARRDKQASHIKDIQVVGRQAIELLTSWQYLTQSEKLALGRLHTLFESAEERLGIPVEGEAAEKYIGEALFGTRYGDLREVVVSTHTRL